LTLLHAAPAPAAGAGRAYVVPDDVKDLVVPVLAHRLIRAPEAEMAGRSTAGILAGVMERVPVPVGPGDGRQPERGVRARTDGGDRGRPA
jgi:MoxR-like ATPase